AGRARPRPTSSPRVFAAGNSGRATWNGRCDCRWSLCHSREGGNPVVGEQEVVSGPSPYSARNRLLNSRLRGNDTVDGRALQALGLTSASPNPVKFEAKAIVRFQRRAKRACHAQPMIGTL